MRTTSRARRDPEQGLAGLRCSICGHPSSGWVCAETIDDQGQDLIEAYSACDLHCLEPIGHTSSEASFFAYGAEGLRPA